MSDGIATGRVDDGAVKRFDGLCCVVEKGWMVVVMGTKRI